jgi:hypothetical protein
MTATQAMTRHEAESGRWRELSEEDLERVGGGTTTTPSIVTAYGLFSASAATSPAYATVAVISTMTAVNLGTAVAAAVTDAAGGW